MITKEQKVEILVALEEGEHLGSVFTRLDIPVAECEAFRFDNRQEVIEAKRCGKISLKILRLENQLDILREEKAVLQSQ